MGLRLTVFASPNTPRALLSVSNRQPIRAPFPPRERGWGERADALRLPWERFCAQYGFIFRLPPKNKSVSSTASDWGLGAEPQACFGSFYTSKRNAPAASRTNQVFYKTCATEGDYRLFHEHPAAGDCRPSPKIPRQPHPSAGSLRSPRRRPPPPPGTHTATVFDHIIIISVGSRKNHEKYPRKRHQNLRLQFQ